jgi:hypothetical protein
MLSEELHVGYASGVVEPMVLHLGEERPIHLPPAPAGRSWSHDLSGMSSAVDVKRMWTSDPYPEDDEDDAPGRPRSMVFLVRGANPGRATIRVSCPGHEDMTIDVEVRS